MSRCGKSDAHISRPGGATCDTDPKRLETVTTLCHRLKLKGVETVVLPENGDPPVGPFDAAFEFLKPSGGVRLIGIE